MLISKIKICDLDNIEKLNSDNVSKIIGGNCQYAGSDYSPGSIIKMPDGNLYQCENNYFSADSWEKMKKDVSPTTQFSIDADAIGVNEF